MIKYKLPHSVHPLSTWDSRSPEVMRSIDFCGQVLHGYKCMLAPECISCLAIALPLTSGVGESCEVNFLLPCSMRMTMTFQTIESLSIFFLAHYR